MIQNFIIYQQLLAFRKQRRSKKPLRGVNIVLHFSKDYSDPDKDHWKENVHTERVPIPPIDHRSFVSESLQVSEESPSLPFMLLLSSYLKIFQVQMLLLFILLLLIGPFVLLDGAVFQDALLKIRPDLVEDFLQGGDLEVPFVDA